MIIRNTSMPAPIQNTLPAQQTNAPKANFSDFLADAVERVKQSDAASIEGNYALLRQDGAELHTILLDAEKADIALQFTIQMRNKLMEAYQEIMRLQL